MPPAFLSDWFSNNIPVWEKHLSHLRGKEVHALEIGCFEGRATCWMLENILTHHKSHITCIDPFPEISREQLLKYADRWKLHDIPRTAVDTEKRFWQNINAIDSAHKVTAHKGLSKYILRALPIRGYDLIYIDGSHFKEDVLSDAVLCWDILKEGGILIFDDYELQKFAPELGNPKPAIDAFLSLFSKHVEVMHKDWQIIVKKREQRRERSDYPPIGVNDSASDLVSITYARNEEDILESFVRYHADIFDRMILVLHNCTDRSQEIVERLKAEGLPIEILFDESAHYAQAEALTGLLRNLEDAQWICPLDADEFLIATEGNPRDILLSSPTDCAYSLPWITYVPTPHDDLSELNPIKRIAHRRAFEPRPFSKVLVPAHLASCISLPRGHHSIISDQPIETREHSALRIAHFPVRTEAQLRTKVINNWNTVQQNPDFTPGTSFQWEQLLDRCKDPAEITKDELCRIALRYALKPHDPETSYVLDGTIESHDT